MQGLACCPSMNPSFKLQSELSPGHDTEDANPRARALAKTLGTGVGALERIYAATLQLGAFVLSGRFCVWGMWGLWLRASRFGEVEAVYNAEPSNISIYPGLEP